MAKNAFATGIFKAKKEGYTEAVSAMKLDGWQFAKPDRVSPEWYHFCPACKERRKKSG